VTEGAGGAEAGEEEWRDLTKGIKEGGDETEAA
jgi:hypothetical protein